MPLRIAWKARKSGHVEPVDPERFREGGERSDKPSHEDGQPEDPDPESPLAVVAERPPSGLAHA